MSGCAGPLAFSQVVTLSSQSSCNFSLSGDMHPSVPRFPIACINDYGNASPSYNNLLADKCSSGATGGVDCVKSANADSPYQSCPLLAVGLACTAYGRPAAPRLKCHAASLVKHSVVQGLDLEFTTSFKATLACSVLPVYVLSNACACFELPSAQLLECSVQAFLYATHCKRCECSYVNTAISAGLLHHVSPHSVLGVQTCV